MPVPASTPRTIQFDKYEVDLPAGHLLKQGVKVRLREQSFVVLAMLLEHPGEVVTREELRRRLWSEDTFVDFDNNLNTAVARLRVALNDPAEHPRFIETLPKRGYRFIGSLFIPAPASGQMTARRAKIAVLPFANLSGHPEQEYFSDAMTEEMITELAGLAPGQLGVIARTTAMHYKTSHKDVARIGRELAVDHIVEGSVPRNDDQIGIIVQLIRVSDQTHLWTKRYETGLRDFLGAVNAAAQAIALEIGIPPAAGKPPHGMEADRRTTGKPTENFTAYNLYIQGRYHLNKLTPEGIATAKQCFEDAIAQEPEFALAYNSVAEVYWYLGFFGLVVPKEAFSMGVWSVLRALEIDDKLAEAHTLLGSFRKELDYNWPEVHREMKRALELDPWSPFARRGYGVSGLMPLGRVEEASRELELGLELDPLSPDLRFWHAYMLLLNRQYERGLQEVQLLIDHAPTYWPAHMTIGHLYGAMKMVDQATAAIRKATDLSGGAPNMLGWLGLALTQSGNTAEARTLLERLHGIASQAYVPPTSFAWIHLGLGDIDSAFAWMDRAIDMRDTMIIPIKTYPFLDPLRADPRFHALLRKMNLEP